MIPAENSRIKDPEDVVSVLAVITLVVGLVWLVFVRDRPDTSRTQDPFSAPQASASTPAPQPGS